jgi:hypothetical protein
MKASDTLTLIEIFKWIELILFFLGLELWIYSSIVDFSHTFAHLMKTPNFVIYCIRVR